MKKFFGIIFILFGIFLIIGGVSTISSISTSRESFEGRVHESVSYEYRSNNDEKEMFGMALIGGGAILLIIGIIMTASKSNSQRKKDAEYEVMRRMQTSSSNSTGNFTEDKLTSLSNKVKENYAKKDYYSAISAVKQIIELTPDDSRRYIDLACLYSLTQNLEAYSALEKAISLGYSNYEKIKTDSNLDWLRGQPDYEKFVANGYKKPAVETPKPEPAPETQMKKESSLNDDVIQKLEKLAELKDRGILTEEEFLREKGKILN